MVDLKVFTRYKTSNGVTKKVMHFIILYTFGKKRNVSRDKKYQLTGIKENFSAHISPIKIL